MCIRDRFEPAISEELDALSERLEAAGHTITRIAIPGREQIAEAHGVIVLSEASSIYADLTDDERGRLGKAAIAGLRHAENLSIEAVDAAWQWSRAASDRMQATLDPVDLLISPALPIAPPHIEARRVLLGGAEVPLVVAMTLLTCLCNLIGNPVVGLPNPLSSAVPRTGLQIMAGLGEDEILFRHAAWIERDTEDPY